MPSFNDILNTKVDEVKPPPPFPAGTYLAITEGLPEWGKSRNGIAQIQFRTKLLQAMTDINHDALMEWRDVTGGEVVGQSLSLFFYDPMPWRLTEFLGHLGLGKLETKMALQESPGRQFLVTLKHSPTQDGRGLRHEVDKTAAV
jgi:hypothetical protein